MLKCYSNSLLQEEMVKFETYSAFSRGAAAQTRAQAAHGSGS